MIKQNVQYIRPVVTGCIGGLASALIVGLLHGAVNLYGSTSWLGAWMEANSTLRYLIDMAVAFVTAFLLSWVLFRWERKSGDRVQIASKTADKEPGTVEKAWGREEMQITGSAQFSEQIPLTENGHSPEERQSAKRGRFADKLRFAKQEEKKQTEMGVIYSPLQGQVIPMEEVPDDTFAAKVLGDGMAVIPSEGVVYAPFDGRVEKVYDAKHAISISSIDGIEVLIHVGINTEESGGNFFEILVSDGDGIKRGDRLLRFDMAEMKEAGYSTVTPVVVTNSDDYDVIYLLGNGVVDQQDILMKV